MDKDKKLNQETKEQTASTSQPSKETPGSAQKSVEKQLLGLKIAVGVLAAAVILLGIKCFWPSEKTPSDSGSLMVSGPDQTSSLQQENPEDTDKENSQGGSEQTPGGNSGDTSQGDSQTPGGNAGDSSQSGGGQTPGGNSGSSSQGGSQTSGGNSGGSSQGNGQTPGGNNENSSQGGEQGGVQSTPAPSTETGGYELVYSQGNSWEESGNKMCTLELALKNCSDSSVKNWTLVLDVDRLVSISGWNGTYAASGNTVTVTPADYNSEVFAGGTIYLGCNIATGSALKLNSATLNGTACRLTAGSVDQNAQNNGGNSGNGGGNSGSGGNNGNGGSDIDVAALLQRTENAKQGDDWLHTDGRRILDKDGKEVWLTGVNWFGYNTGTNTFDGLWNSKLEPTVKAIADHGFNLIRVPFSAQLINQWAAGEYPQANFNQAYNPSLTSMNSLEIFEYFLKLAEASGIKVMIDIHSAETNASGHMVNLWYAGSVTTEDYYRALEWMAARYKDNDTIIAYDLKNEPHGKPDEGDSAAIWNDSKKSNNWKYVAETAAARVLAQNPNVLILVEGTEIYPKNNSGDYSSANSGDYYFNWWGGNLRAVKDFPINLGDYQNKLVYSPHDYGPTVYQQPWFSNGYTYDSLMKDCWHDNWFFIYEDNTAPLLIGEWGGFMREPNLTWMTYMRRLISTYRLNHTFWCLNANSGDTGGLLLDDFTTWDNAKYEFVKEVLWQENGKFVGLDHAIPLGDNGITLSDANGF